VTLTFSEAPGHAGGGRARGPQPRRRALIYTDAGKPVRTKTWKHVRFSGKHVLRLNTRSLPAGTYTVSDAFGDRRARAVRRAYVTDAGAGRLTASPLAPWQAARGSLEKIQ